MTTNWRSGNRYDSNDSLDATNQPPTRVVYNVPFRSPDFIGIFAQIPTRCHWFID
jgi:hypothetical protein